MATLYEILYHDLKQFLKMGGGEYLRKSY